MLPPFRFLARSWYSACEINHITQCAREWWHEQWLWLEKVSLRVLGIYLVFKKSSTIPALSILGWQEHVEVFCHFRNRPDALLNLESHVGILVIRDETELLCLWKNSVLPLRPSCLLFSQRWLLLATTAIELASCLCSYFLCVPLFPLSCQAALGQWLPPALFV